jgi:hypothetical protein
MRVPINKTVIIPLTGLSQPLMPMPILTPEPVLVPTPVLAPEPVLVPAPVLDDEVKTKFYAKLTPRQREILAVNIKCIHKLQDKTKTKDIMRQRRLLQNARARHICYARKKLKQKLQTNAN